ncbi:hypothetical protein [Kingella potus]|uniref:hypothetical protein n=1 Tax=Kingella potus TaxID=265175 RepID=UPI001FCFAC91|nr:hypothetical protein [Kingella potus]UOP01295.1 hypothetical protein LVJ84_03310 [Kingella potus]
MAESPDSRPANANRLRRCTAACAKGRLKPIFRRPVLYSDSHESKVGCVAQRRRTHPHRLQAV